jgi:AcrR family transcriptional regulator
MTANLSLRERRRVEIRRELAAAAIELFERDGAAATTVDSIVAAAGCSASTFFRHFPTKEDTVFFDAPDVLDALREAVRAAGPDRDVWEIVCAGLVQGGVDFVESGDELAMARLRLYHRDPAIAAKLAEIYAQREAVIAGFFLDELGAGPEAEFQAWLQAGAIIAAVRASLRSVATHGGNLAQELDRAFRRVEQGFTRPHRRNSASAFG